MPKVIYENKIFDSQEELDFYHWCVEAMLYGLISYFIKCEKGRDTTQLIEKTYYLKNGKKKHCFASVDFTPDFKIADLRIKNMLEKNIDGENVHTIDIKPSFSRHNDNKQFQIIRKMMFKLKGVFVHKITPDELFLKTWIPEKCRYTKVKCDIKKKFLNTPTISEYLKKRSVP